MADYLELGFNNQFQRKPPQSTVQIEDLPQLPSNDLDTIIQEMSGNKISGGVIQSKDGSLTIDLDNGKILYNDGVQDILNLGENKNLVIKSQSGNTIIST